MEVASSDQSPAPWATQTAAAGRARVYLREDAVTAMAAAAVGSLHLFGMELFDEPDVTVDALQEAVRTLENGIGVDPVAAVALGCLRPDRSPRRQ